METLENPHPRDLALPLLQYLDYQVRCRQESQQLEACIAISFPLQCYQEEVSIYFLLHFS